MNKQALAFLTMFSLVLMLSVYYVTLPDDTAKTVMKDESGKTVNKDTAKKDTAKSDTSDTKGKTDSTTGAKENESGKESTAASSLQESIDQKKEVEINKNSDIVANADSDEQAKQKALSSIDNLKSQKTLQKSIVDALAKDGYKAAVEINDTTCIVNVFDVKDDKDIAKKILLKTNSLTNNKYLVEVTFK